MSTSVKFLHSAMVGAPVLSGTAGTMISLLDACLKDGFGLKTVDSLVIASGVATATISTGHAAFEGCVVTIAGATVSGGTINGEHRALTAPTNVVTFDATGLADQTASGGAITLKISPLGFTKPYSGTNLAVYQSSDVASLDMLLRVDDTGTTDARVVGYETMSDISTGTGPFPTSAQFSGGYYWPKSRTADATARSWILVGDERAFILAVACDSVSLGRYFTMTFGDIVPESSSDAYACLLSGAGVTALGNALSSMFAGSLANDHPGTTGVMAFPRSYTGVGTSVLARRWSGVMHASANHESGDTNGLTPYPNGPNGGLYVSPLRCGHDGTKDLRGIVPGAYHTPQSIGATTFTSLDSVTGITGLSGRTLRAIDGSVGVMFVDATGPWR